MDSDQFDRLSRIVGRASTRRTLSRALAGVAFGSGLVALPGAEADAKKKCGPCRKKKHGKCKGPKPDNTACNGDGRCLAGTCIAHLNCLGTGIACTQGNPGACCSGVCRTDDHCQNSQDGQTCLIDADCITPSLCVGYQCRQP